MTADAFEKGESAFAVIISVEGGIDYIVRSAVSGTVNIRIAVFLNAYGPFLEKNIGNLLNKLFVSSMCDYTDRSERGHRSLIIT
jgi:hypothetical protein